MLGETQINPYLALCKELCDLIILQKNTTNFHWRFKEDSSLSIGYEPSCETSIPKIPLEILCIISKIKKLFIDFSWIVESKHIKNIDDNDPLSVFIATLQEFLLKFEKRILNIRNCPKSSLIRLIIMLLSLDPLIDLFLDYLPKSSLENEFLFCLQNHQIIFLEDMEFRLDYRILNSFERTLFNFFNSILVIDEPHIGINCSLLILKNDLSSVAKSIYALRRSNFSLVTKVHQFIKEGIIRIQNFNLFMAHDQKKEFLVDFKNNFKEIYRTLKSDFLYSLQKSNQDMDHELNRFRTQFYLSHNEKKKLSEKKMNEALNLRKKYLDDIVKQLDNKINQNNTKIDDESNIFDPTNPDDLTSVAHFLVEEHFYKYEQLMEEQCNLISTISNVDRKALEQMFINNQKMALELDQKITDRFKTKKISFFNKNTDQKNIDGPLKSSINNNSNKTLSIDRNYDKFCMKTPEQSIASQKNVVSEEISTINSPNVFEKSFDVIDHLSTIDDKIIDENCDKMMTSVSKKEFLSFDVDDNAFLDSDCNIEYYVAYLSHVQAFISELCFQMKLLDNMRLIFTNDFVLILDCVSKFMLLLDTTLDSAISSFRCQSNICFIEYLLPHGSNVDNMSLIDSFSSLVILIKNSKFKDIIELHICERSQINDNSSSDPSIVDYCKVDSSQQNSELPFNSDPIISNEYNNEVYFSLNKSSMLLHNYFSSDCFQDFCRISCFFIKIKNCISLIEKKAYIELPLGKLHRFKSPYLNQIISKNWICSRFYVNICNYLFNLVSDLLEKFKKSITTLCDADKQFQVPSSNASRKNIGIKELMKGFVDEVCEIFFIKSHSSNNFFGSLISTIIGESLEFSKSNIIFPCTSCDSDLYINNANIINFYDSAMNYRQILISSLSDVEEFCLDYKFCGLFLIL